MANQSGEKLSGLGMVIPHLAAAVGMGERAEPVNASFYQMLVFPDQRCSNAVDAADSRDNPELVAHGSTPVLPEITHKGSRFYIRHWKRLVVVSILCGFT